MGEGAAGVVGLQLGCGLFMGLSHDDAAAFKATAAFLQGPCDIGQILFGMGAQMGGQGLGIGIKGGFGTTRNGQDLERPFRGFGSRARGRFLQHHMRIGAAHAKGVHPGTARAFMGDPVAQAIIDGEGGGLEINRRIRGLIAQRGRDFAVMQRHRGFDQPSHACGGIKMPDIGLNRP